MRNIHIIWLDGQDAVFEDYYFSDSADDIILTDSDGDRTVIAKVHVRYYTITTPASWRRS